MHAFIVLLGKVLFQLRAVIAVPFFIFLVIFSRPTDSLITSYILIGAGLILRIWAAGYIGTQSRLNKFTTSYVVINGPYKLLKHPLYISNLLLVLGVIILFNPALWYALLLIAIFIIEYSIIVYSELNYLKDLPKKSMKFNLVNIKGEISTIVVVIIIILIYYFVGG
jgi:protein-S-isoprenylcysteine O-methyltransferase Ste14